MPLPTGVDVVRDHPVFTNRSIWPTRLLGLESVISLLSCPTFFVKTIFPFSLLYGTIELDHTGVVREFKDPEADETVRSMAAKKHLIRIHLVCLIPLVRSLRRSRPFLDTRPLRRSEHPMSLQYGDNSIQSAPR